MDRTVLAYIRQFHMIEPGDVVCAACSGGADSICLLAMLCVMKSRGDIDFELTACHLNHALRGDDSDADQAFVEQFCAQRGIPLYCRKEDVAARAAENKTGLEAAGRAAREDLFRFCMEEHGVTKIALAHHMDDQAETVLFHMARGAGLAGMAGIRPVNGGRIRPLLCLKRSEIEAWLGARGLTYRTDSSNEEDHYTRNRLRHLILPGLDETIHKEAARHIAQAAEDIRQADVFIEEEAKRRKAFLVKQPSADGTALLIKKEALAEPGIILRSMILQVLEELAGTRADFSRAHVLQVLDLLEGGVSRQTDLPHGVTALRTYEGVLLFRGKPEKTAGCADAAVIDLTAQDEKNYFLGACGFRARMTASCPDPIPEKPYTKWLNCDMISDNLVIRTRKPGDYLILDRQGRRQSLKSWMINQKIPVFLRDRIPVLASGQEVLWIVGGRISAAARVTEHTRRILKIECLNPEIFINERRHQGL